MKIIYHCYGGSHSSVTAAGIHLGLLPSDRLPSLDMFMKVPYFDRQINEDHGYLRFMGKDDKNNDVYIVGRRSLGKFIENAYASINDIFNLGEELYLVDVMPYVNWYMVVGGTASRKFGWIRFGRPIVLKGTQHSYFKIANLVEKTKMKTGGLL